MTLVVRPEVVSLENFGTTNFDKGARQTNVLRARVEEFVYLGDKIGISVSLLLISPFLINSPLMLKIE